MQAVYILIIGDPKYAQWAVNFAASVKFYSPSMHIVALHEPGYLKNILEHEKFIFDEFIEIKNDHCYADEKLTPGIAKLNIYEYLKHDECLYVDVDSLCIKDIQALFYQNAGKVIGCDTSWAGDEKSDQWNCHWSTMEDVKKYYKLPSTYKIFEINSSYIYVKRGQEAEAFFKQAQENIIPNYVGKWGQAFPDELAFNVAFAQTGIDPSGKNAITWNSTLSGVPKEVAYLVPHYFLLTYWGGKDNRYVRHYQNYDRLAQVIHRKIFGKHNPYKYSELMQRKYIQVHRSIVKPNQPIALPMPAKMAQYERGPVAKITIVGRENGAGLSKDRIILADIFKEYDVDFRSCDRFIPLKNSDVNIFTEVVNPQYFGKYNILIPNQEWFETAWIQHLKKFHAIWVKTKLAYKIFSSMHPNVQYIGFTSVDLFKEGEKFKECFHTQGKSSDKGTEFLNNWPADIPRLNFISGKINQSNNPNVSQHKNQLAPEKFLELANRSLIHLCPSTMEGFGHYINEAKSMANVVITTDSAPMNELITDGQFLCKIKSAKTKPGTLGTYTYTDAEELMRAIRSTMEMDLIDIGKENRAQFLKQDQEFKETIIYEFGKI